MNLRFNQLTTDSGILAGRVKRSDVRSCELCAAIVALENLAVHARYHGARGDLTDYRGNPGMTENGGDRWVEFNDRIAEVWKT